ncbi:Tyrosine recombinase XerC [bioreactor metagenome]|uniref:Tyrosine recombinase XerC n=1 Tax=bioreactor metagenome TaxID=1076179 RepID=A0A644YJ48_9ZZZZ
MGAHVRKRGSFWEYSVELGVDPVTNKRKRKAKSGFKTKKECEKAMNELINQINNNNYFEPEKIVFRNFANQYLDEMKFAVREKTLERYDEIVNKHLIPYFGDLEMHKITSAHIHKFYETRLSDGNSSTTLKFYNNILTKIFSMAISNKVIKENPMVNVRRPKVARKDFNVWTVEQTNIFLDSVKDSSLYMLTLLAVTTGMRRGELCGLRWQNVNLDTGEIYVKEQLQEINKEVKVCPPKTMISRRKIIMLDYVIPILKEFKASQEEYLKNNNLKCDYVLQTYKGEPCNPNLITKKFTSYARRIMKELNLPVLRFHDLRHTHATQLLLAGVHPKIVADRLGHSSTTMTLEIYSHVIPSMQVSAAEKLNRLYT